MGESIKPHKMLVLVINAYLLSIAQGEKEYLSNYTNANMRCHNRGGLITQKLLKFGGLINNTCELGVNNDVLKDGESVWIEGQAQTGVYIALHTCMRFSNQDIHSFAKHSIFNFNILYECSVFCDQILHSIGFIGIIKQSCYCMYDSFRFPHTPECLEIDFMDTHKRIIVFRLMGNLQFKDQSKSANFNCLGASFQDSGKTSYYNTKCPSTLYSICTQRVDSDLSNKCLPRVDGFCLNEENNTFLEHYRKCWQYNGTLIPFNSGVTVSLNYSVMLGSFRAFKAIEDDGTNNGTVTWSCLSITKFNGTIYLETEKCSNENTFICMDDIKDASNKEEPETTDVVSITIVIVSLASSLIVVVAVALYCGLKRPHNNSARHTAQKGRKQQSDEGISLKTDERSEEETQLNGVNS